MGNQKHRKMGITTIETRRMRVRFSAERARNGKDKANIDKGISASRPKGNSAKKDTVSQQGQSAAKRLNSSFI